MSESNIVLEAKGITKQFPGVLANDNVNFDLRKGEIHALLGENGAGKSTLMNLIYGLHLPDKGEVIVLGQEVDKLKGKELDALRLRIGFSFQNSALYDGMNVYQNLAFPLTMNFQNMPKKEVVNAVEEVLEAVGLKDKIKQMPSDLSGGQRKRIGIARTLILKPEIMLYDEPTSGLDPITSAEIIDLINEVQELYNTSSVIITHDLTCAKNTGNRIAMMFEGKFLKTGTFNEVFDTEDAQLKGFFNYNFIK